jgi:hypothetical protein
VSHSPPGNAAACDDVTPPCPGSVPVVSIPGTVQTDLLKSHLADLSLSTTAWSEFLSASTGQAFEARSASAAHWLSVYEFRRDLAVERGDDYAADLGCLVDHLESHPGTEAFLVLAVGVGHRRCLPEVQLMNVHGPVPVRLTGCAKSCPSASPATCLVAVYGARSPGPSVGVLAFDAEVFDEVPPWVLT